MLTSTAEVLGTVTQVVSTGNVSPTTLTVLGGVVLSHITGPLASKIPAALGIVKPLIVAASHVAAAAAVTSFSTGTPFTANLGTGLVAAASAKIYHIAALKPNGFLSTLLAGLKKQ